MDLTIHRVTTINVSQQEFERTDDHPTFTRLRLEVINEDGVMHEINLFLSDHGTKINGELLSVSPQPQPEPATPDA